MFCWRWRTLLVGVVLMFDISENGCLVGVGVPCWWECSWCLMLVLLFEVSFGVVTLRCAALCLVWLLILL